MPASVPIVFYDFLIRASTLSLVGFVLGNHQSSWSDWLGQSEAGLILQDLSCNEFLLVHSAD